VKENTGDGRKKTLKVEEENVTDRREENKRQKKRTQKVKEKVT